MTNNLRKSNNYIMSCSVKCLRPVPRINNPSLCVVYVLILFWSFRLTVHSSIVYGDSHAWSLPGDSIFCKPGRTAKTARKDDDYSEFLAVVSTADTVFIVLGGNDIASSHKEKGNIRPAMLAITGHLIDLVKDIRGSNGHAKIVILDIFPRKNVPDSWIQTRRMVNSALQRTGAIVLRMAKKIKYHHFKVTLPWKGTAWCRRPYRVAQETKLCCFTLPNYKL